MSSSRSGRRCALNPWGNRKRGERGGSGGERKADSARARGRPLDKSCKTRAKMPFIAEIPADQAAPFLTDRTPEESRPVQVAKALKLSALTN